MSNLITKRWFPATIKALCPEPRSYQIETKETMIKELIIAFEHVTWCQEYADASFTE